MKKKDIMTTLQDAVLRGDTGQIEHILKGTSSAVWPAKDVHAALCLGIEEARTRLIHERISIPEFLLCIDAFKAGAARVKNRGTAGKGIPVFIGVVEGDVHDLGKNIVAGVLSACGYPVTDMGRDVTREMIRGHITGRKKAVVALSSMMSTSLGPMKECIAWLAEAGPGIKSLVGGASLDSKIAQSLGADGYAESAAKAPDELRRILAALA